MTADIKSDVALPPEINKYLAILSKDPGSMVFAPLAEAYRKAGMLDEAIATAQDGLKSHPNYLSGMVALGRAYYEKGMFKEAGESLEQVIRMAPDNIIAANILEEISTKAAAAGQQKIEEPETAEILEVEEVTELIEAEEEAESFQVDDISIEAPEPGFGFTIGTEEPVSLPVEASNETIAGPVDVEPNTEVRPAAPSIRSKEDDEARPRKEITTETIAELYIKQGYLDKAIDVYQTLYDADPGNEEIKSKLDELKQGAEVGEQRSDVVVQHAVPVQEAVAIGPDKIVVSPEIQTQNSKLKTDENKDRLESWLKTIQSERRKG